MSAKDWLNLITAGLSLVAIVASGLAIYWVMKAAYYRWLREQHEQSRVYWAVGIPPKEIDRSLRGWVRSWWRSK